MRSAPTGSARPRLARVTARLFVAGALVAGFLIAVGATAAVSAPSFTFGAAGDIGATINTDYVLRKAGASNLDLFLAVGDLSYDQLTPPAWCQRVKDDWNAGAGLAAGSAYGSTFPFQIVTGNHEATTIDEYLTPTCLPDRLGTTPSPIGGYGKEYSFDYPSAAPLARFIMTSPGALYSYAKGTAHYQWLSDTIDAAHAAGIRWVIVGDHLNYVSIGTTGDEVGSDFFNLLVAKKVDLVLQGHDHDWQRTKQFGLSSACQAVPTGRVNSTCVVNDGASGQFAAGKGPLVVVTGGGGRSTYPIVADDNETGYFASGLQNTYGFGKFTVTDTSLSGEFVQASGAVLTDTFAVTQAAAEDTLAPSAPTGLSVTSADDLQVSLGWGSAVDDRGVAGYRILRDGVEIATSASTSFRDTTVAGGARYTYSAVAYDAAGNRGPVSNQVVVKTAPTVSLATTATDDTTVKKDTPAKNFGSTATIKSDGVPIEDGLVKFTVTGTAGYAVRRATLVMVCANPSNKGGDLRTTATNWSQSTATWDNAPAGSAVTLASLGPVTDGAQVSVDVTSAVTRDGTYSFRVTNTSDDGAEYKTREAGLASAPRLVLTLAKDDVAPPSAPGSPTATNISPTQVDLSWAAATDDSTVAGYRVIRNGAVIATVNDGTDYSDTTVRAATAYTYAVRAFDTSGKTGPDSDAAVVTTPPPPDTVAPSVVTDVVAAATSTTTASVSWSEATDDTAVTGYRVYRNGVLVSPVTGTQLADAGLTPGTTYSYTVKAVDAAGNVGPLSVPVSLDHPAVVAGRPHPAQRPGRSAGTGNTHAGRPVVGGVDRRHGSRGLRGAAGRCCDRHRRVDDDDVPGHLGGRRRGLRLHRRRPRCRRQPQHQLRGDPCVRPTARHSAGRTRQPLG